VAKAKKVSEYTNKAIDTIYNKTIDPVVDKIASIDFAGSYFSNPHIPDYQKFAALNRSFVKNDSAVFGITGRPTPPLPQKEIKMNYWKYIGLGLAAAVTFGAVGYAVQNKHLDNVNNDISSGIAYAELQATGAASSFTDFLNSITNQAPVANIKIDTSPDKMIAGEKIVFNASGSYDPDGKIKEYKWFFKKDGWIQTMETETTTIPILEKVLTENYDSVMLNVKDDKGKIAQSVSIEIKRQYDYYDKEFDVGIYIDGDKQFKQNVTNLLETFKQVTPDDYSDLIEYAPKKIVRSPDGFSWYGLGSDSIKLPKRIEEWGGSDNMDIRKGGLPNLYAEFRNAKEVKSGRTPSVLEQEKTADAYGVKIGVCKQWQANQSLEYVSEKLKKGTYFDGMFRYNETNTPKK